MSPQEVIALIGAPLERGPLGMSADGSPRGPELWVYDSDALLGGISFTLRFEGASLQIASASYRYLLSKKSTSIYALNAAVGILEGPEFSEWFSCDPKRVAVR